MQVKAVYLCELMDMARRADEKDRSLRQSLLQTGRFEFADLFPEAVEATSEEDIDAALALDPNEAEVSYVFQQDDDFDPAEAERMLAELMAQASEGTASGELFLDGFDG